MRDLAKVIWLESAYRMKGARIYDRASFYLVHFGLPVILREVRVLSLREVATYYALFHPELLNPFLLGHLEDDV